MKGRWISILTGLVWAFPALWVAGATFTVSTLTDNGAGSLRQAILDANTAPGDDTITFSVTGTITLTTNLPQVTDNTAFIGPGTNLLTISGANQYRIFYLTSAANSLSDLTIAQGHASVDSHYAPTNASGVCSRGALSMVRCVVRNCTNANSLGVGIYSGGNLEMRGCSVTGCKAPNFYSNVRGAGLYNDGMASITDCYFGDCSGSWSGATGSGIYSAGSLFLTNSTVYRCYGVGSAYADGGGIAALGNATLNNCLITRCSGFWGGGVEASANLTMINSCVISNSGYSGGGVLNWGSGIFSGCTISGNHCGSSLPCASGVINAGYLEMRNCTLSQNSADYSPGFGNSNPAGGFSDIHPYSGKSVGVSYLDHCTILSNTGLFEISVPSTNFHAANSILADCHGTIVSGARNLIAQTNGTAIVGDESGNLYQVDPLLGPLQNNGGPTPTHALLPGSPAIDHADAGSVITDQRGAARPSDPLASDIGAYEVVTVMPPNLQISASGPAQVTLYWPSAPGPVVLQQNSDPGSAGWSDVGTYPTDDRTTTRLVLPASAKGFFRLRSP